VSKSIEHPITEIDDFKTLLKNNKVGISASLEKKMKARPNVTPEKIRSHLKSPNDLEEFNYQDDNRVYPKYASLFNHSNKYWMNIIVSFREEITYVVTAHIANKSKKDKVSLLNEG
jgi:hypothetical protein